MGRFEEIQTFIKVVKAGSLSAAADRLDIAKSAVSRRLSDLENRLGVQLLTRTTRRLNLTENGRQYFQRCQTILADLEDTEHSITSGDLALTGTIRMAAPLSFGITHLSPVLNEFLELHPELKLDLDLNDRTLNFMEEEVDLAIRIGKLADSSLVARKLATSQLIVCASPSYFAQHGEPKHPRDLEQHAGLSYSYSDPQYWHFMNKDKKEITIRMNYRIRANNGDVLLKAAIDGLGIVMMPSFIGTEAIKRKQLIPVLRDYALAEAAIYAIYPQQRYLPQRIRVLIDFLVDRFQGKLI